MFAGGYTAVNLGFYALAYTLTFGGGRYLFFKIAGVLMWLPALSYMEYVIVALSGDSVAQGMYAQWLCGDGGGVRASHSSML